MAFCEKCGTKLSDDTKFCPGCGVAIEVSEQSTHQQNNFGSKIQGLNNTTDSTTEYMQDDISENKIMGVLSYFGILCLIPLLAAPKSKFARYHANQGLVLLISEIAFGIVYMILSTILTFISWRLYFIVTILGLLWIVFGVLAIIGIINAAGGKVKELPLIGKMKILK